MSGAGGGCWLTIIGASPPRLVELALDRPHVGPRAGGTHDRSPVGAAVDLDHPPERHVLVGVGSRAAQRTRGHHRQPYRRRPGSLRRPAGGETDELVLIMNPLC